ELELTEPVRANLALSRRTRHRALRPSEHSAYTRQQFAGTEWLGQVVIGAEFQTHDSVRFVAYTGEHDDRNRGFIAQRPGDCHPILACKSQIEDDEIDRLVVQDPRHLIAGRSDAHAQPV